MAQKSPLHFLSFVLILLVIFGVIFFVNPWRADVATLEAAISAQTAQISSLQSEVDRLTALQSSVAENSQEATTLSAAIPDAFQEDAVIQTFSSLAKEHNFNLHSISFGTSATKDSVSSFSIGVSLSGAYDDLGAFLKDVEGADRQYTVRTISVQVTPADPTDEDAANDVATTEFSLSIDAYYVEDTASAAS